MGTGCSKAFGLSLDGNGVDAAGTLRNKIFASDENGTNPFTISIECYCVPSSRILSRPTSLLGPGAGCRSVVVTTIKIEKRQHNSSVQKTSKLNSAVHTPVIQWFGIDLIQQVPKYLPMNLWPGSYTLFGFYNPEKSASTCVKLTAKVGSEEICLQENMDTERCLSNEKWAKLSRLMEKELQKLTVPVNKVSYEHDEDSKLNPVESNITKEEITRQRISVDTGYMSTKQSLQLQQSVHFIGSSSDSEETDSVKERYSYKKNKFRRKDTPVHNLHHMKLHAQVFKDSSLQEESETIMSSGQDSLKSRPGESIFLRPVSSLGINTADAEADESLNLQQLCLSKSHCDLQSIEYISPENSQCELNEGGNTQSSRRKKRSIISKIGGISANDEFETTTSENAQQLEKESDNGFNADDEADIGYTENDKLFGNTSPGGQTKDGKLRIDSKENEEETREMNISEDTEKEETFAGSTFEDSQKDHYTGNQNVERTIEKNPSGEEKKEINQSVINKSRYTRKNSFSNTIEKQIPSNKDEDDHLCNTKDAKEGQHESEIIKAEKIEQMDRFVKQPINADDGDERTEGEEEKQKCTDDFEGKRNRPRSRTISNNKQGRPRFIRQSESVIITTSSATPELEESFQGITNKKTASDITQPPLTPKKAFSDA